MKLLIVLVFSLFATSVNGAQKPDSPTLKRIGDRNFINIGYISTPGTFAFEDEKGRTTGYSIEICNKVIENIRLALKRPNLSVNYIPIKANQRIPLLKSGDIDMECGGNTNTAARQKEVDFSFTFFTTGARFLTKRTFHVKSYSDLWRKRIAVTKGTTAEGLVKKMKLDHALDVVQVESDLEGLKLVESSQADAFAQDDVLLYGLMTKSKLRDELMISGRFLSIEPYAFMLPKGDIGLIELVDRTLLSLMNSGELMLIYRKWFETENLNIPMNIHMRENIRFPNKYGIP